MKIWTKTCVAAAATAFLATSVPAFAKAPEAVPAPPPAESGRTWHEADKNWQAMRHEHEERRSQRLREAAQYFGIKIEGKTDEQLRDELRKAREADPAKWEKFKAELKAKRLVRLQAEAKSLGITTEGKDARALHEEIRAKRKEDCAEKKEKAASKPEGAPSTAPAPSNHAATDSTTKSN